MKLKPILQGGVCFSFSSSLICQPFFSRGYSINKLSGETGRAGNNPSPSWKVLPLLVLRDSQKGYMNIRWQVYDLYRLRYVHPV